MTAYLAWHGREYNGELRQRLSVASLNPEVNPNSRSVTVGLPGRGREYNGELRQRLSVASLKTLNCTLD